MDYINKQWMVQSANSIPRQFITEGRMLHGTSVQEAIGQEFRKWRPDAPVFIEAPTGTGKTSFIYDHIVPDALSKQQTVLIISNRIALNQQQRDDLKIRFREQAADQISDIPSRLQEYFVGDKIATVTYQGLKKFLEISQWYIESQWYESLRYVVFDEVHFGYSDALFNGNCRIILKESAKCFRNAVRIYMTATPWQISKEVIQNECETLLGINHFDISKAVNSDAPPTTDPLKFGDLYGKAVYKLLYYRMDADYSDYRLVFIGDELDYPPLPPKYKSLSSIRPKSVRALLSHICNAANSGHAGDRWMIFVDNKLTGQKIREALSHAQIDVVYFDAETKKPKKIWDKMIKEHCFDCDVLITTRVIENGVNFWDKKIRNIVLFTIDRTTFVQELGRKRRLPGEKVNVYALVPTTAHLKQLKKSIDWHLGIARVLKTPMHYGDGVKRLWDNPKKIRYRSLFYVDQGGTFRVNDYVAEILREQCSYVESLITNNNYQEVVGSWIHNADFDVTLDYSEDPESILYDRLTASLGKSMSEEEFCPLRQAIIDEAIRKKVEYIRMERRERLSAKPLNRYLEVLGIPLQLKKADKHWVITEKE